MLEEIRDVGIEILNGSVARDEEGGIYICGEQREHSYRVCDRRGRDKGKIRRLEIGDRIHSDHQPLIVYVEEKRTRGNDRAEGKRMEKG